MRTNIVIDDKLMDFVMSTGDFKTKREAVEEGLRMLMRRKAYAAIRAARGTLFWDDSDAGWSQYRAEQMEKAKAKAAGKAFEGELDPLFESPNFVVHEAIAEYKVNPKDAA